MDAGLRTADAGGTKTEIRGRRDRSENDVMEEGPMGLEIDNSVAIFGPLSQNATSGTAGILS